MLTNHRNDGSPSFPALTPRGLLRLGRELKSKRGMMSKERLKEEVKGIGIGIWSFYRVQRGERPSYETFSKICKWLEIAEEEFLECQNQ